MHTTQGGGTTTKDQEWYGYVSLLVARRPVDVRNTGGSYIRNVRRYGHLEEKLVEKQIELEPQEQDKMDGKSAGDDAGGNKGGHDNDKVGDEDNESKFYGGNADEMKARMAKTNLVMKDYMVSGGARISLPYFCASAVFIFLEVF